MDVVNQGLARFVELYKAMAPSARLWAVLSVVLVLASIAWLFGEHVAPAESYLMGGRPFSATQLQQMESALGQAGLTDYEIEGARIRVPHGQQAKYMAALAESSALPADFGDYLRKAVNTSGFMLYGPRQEAQLKVAIQSELQGLINNFQGIERSFVQIAEETSQGFPQTKVVTASVGVQPSSQQPLDERTVSAIRWIVASAWGGLKPESVTVVDLSSKRLFAGPISTGGAVGAYAESKKQMEADWQEKISRVLGIPGAIVTTNVELTEDGLAPRQVSVSVAIPVAHFMTVWQQTHGTAPGARPARPDQMEFASLERDESDRIKQAILPLVVCADPEMDRNQLVAVSTVYPTPTPISSQPSFEELALEWLVENWRTVGLGALVVVGLMVLRSTVLGAAQQAATDASSSVSDDAHSLLLVADDEHRAHEAENTAVPPPHMPSMPADARRAELAEMIRQDPEAAASVLRTWIGNAS